MSSRAESGPIQFGNDWRGIHLRGDNAFHLAMMMRIVMELHPELKNNLMIGPDFGGYIKLFEAANEASTSTDYPVQKCKPWEECKTDG